MDKLEEFKEFIKDKKFLSDKVNSGETSWQKLYETYDLFGKEADVFKEETRSAPTSLLKMLEGINLEKISENLEGAIEEINVREDCCDFTANHLIRFYLENEERLVTIEAFGKQYEELLKKVKELWDIR